MEIGLIMQRIKFYLTKPITIISLLAIVFTVILLAGTSFILPDFYNNREQALALAQTVSPSDVGAATASLESLQHKIFNTVFQIWGWLIVLLLFIFSCKIDFFRSFSNIKIFKNKIIRKCLNPCTFSYRKSSIQMFFSLYKFSFILFHKGHFRGLRVNRCMTPTCLNCK